MRFEFEFPTRVIIGDGTSEETGKLLSSYGVRRILCVYDQGLKATGIPARIINMIKQEGIEVVEYDKVLPDPSDDLVNDVGEYGCRENVDSILGIGGGSSLDVAKAANILLTNPAPINSYFGPDIEQKQKPGKRIFTIPTTSGTGAEVSNFAVVTDTKNNIKTAVVSANCAPTLAIVDPQLVVGLPSGLTASTGLDTLAHNIESYVSKLHNPMSDILAEKGIALAFKYLPISVADGKNIEARNAMSFACTLGSMAFSKTLLIVGHSLGTPFGTRFHVPHGTACGVFLPAVVEYIADGTPDRIRKIGELMGLSLAPDLTPNELGLAVGGALRAVVKAIKLPTLKELGVTPKDIPLIAQDAMEDMCVGFTPKEVTFDDLVKLVQKEYDLG